MNALLYISIIWLAMSSEFTRKQGFKLKKIKNLICEKCRWDVQQGRTNRKYYKSIYLIKYIEKE